MKLTLEQLREIHGYDTRWTREELLAAEKEGAARFLAAEKLRSQKARTGLQKKRHGSSPLATDRYEQDIALGGMDYGS